MSAGKHESVLAVYVCNIFTEAFDCRKVFRFFSGMIGNSAECYADAVLPTLSLGPTQMTPRLPGKVATYAIAIGLLTACAPLRAPFDYEAQPDQMAKHTAAEALDQYVASLRAQDSRAIALMFVPEGRLQHVGQEPVIGRERIEKFIASFENYKVLSHDMIVMSSSAATSHVSQSGTYIQKVRAPDGKEVTMRGWFLFQWQRQEDGKWLLESARTSSSPPASGA